MREYTEYKDSGVSWIGMIPIEWNTSRIQWGLEEINESNSPIQTESILSLTIKDGVIPYEEKGNVGNKSKEDLTQYKVAFPNTLVINSMNVIIGAVGISNYHGCVSPVYYVFKSTDKSDLRFISYIFKLPTFQKELRKYANGILEIRLRISVHDVMRRIIPFPKKETQIAIANYLDKKIARIDDIIAEAKASIEEYKAWKASLIYEAVTKGLDPNAEMKDSGVEWIGETPCSWKTDKLKRLFSFGKGLPITKENLTESGFPVISYGQIHSKKNTGTRVSEDLIRFVSEEYLSTNPESLAQKGDFLFADTSEDIEGCGNAVYVDVESPLFAGYHTIILKSINEENDNKYLAYLFRTDIWRQQIRARASGVKLYSISQKIIKQATVILPPVDEQKRIVKLLDKQCLAIDNTIAQKEMLITDLESYKKSLIFEVVTGKRRVC